MASPENLDDIVLSKILSRCRNVAVVGLSGDPSRPSYVVAEYLKNHGFHIFPVNPFVAEVLGEKSFKSLFLKFKLDCLDIGAGASVEIAVSIAAEIVAAQKEKLFH